MNSQELAWFKPYTWNGERVTKVYLEAFDIYIADKISKTIEGFLLEMKFKSLDPPPTRFQKKFGGWELNLADRTFKRVTQWEITIGLKVVDTEPRHTILPSHLSLYLDERRGHLTGVRFGI